MKKKRYAAIFAAAITSVAIAYGLNISFSNNRVAAASASFADPAAVWGRGWGTSVADLDLTESEAARVVQGFEDVVRNRLPNSALVLSPNSRAVGGPKLAIHQEKGRKVIEQLGKLQTYRRTEHGAMVRYHRPTGKKLTATKHAKLQVSGRLFSGQSFMETSIDSISDATTAGQLLPCWKEVLEELSTNDNVRVVCPAELAFGEFGYPPLVYPGAAVMFDLKLMEGTR